ncbi:MAG TPA: hypothetical protein PLO06_08350 [Methanoregulaceae archaeon]|nr:hypothetical protein [Methanoregulaceae archaeon]
MRIGPWEVIRSKILDRLSGLRGEDELVTRVFTTIGYAFISALCILVVGFLVYLVTLIPVFPPVLPTLVILVIGFVLAGTTITYDEVPFATPRLLMIAAGIIYFMVLLTTNAIFQLVWFLQFLGFFFYFFFMTVFLTIVYWFFTDFYARFSG